MLELLKKAGLPEEQAQIVVDRFPELIKDRYVPVSRIKELSEEIKGLNAQLSERDNQLKQLNDSVGDNEALKNQIKQLQEENVKGKEQFEKDLSDLKFESALERALLKEKAIDGDLVKVKLNREGLRLKEDNTIEGLKEQLETVKKDYGFLFESPAKTQITGVAPVEGAKNNKALSKEEFNKMGYSDRLKLKESQPELYQSMIGGTN